MQTYLESITQGTMENIWNVQKAEGGAKGLNVEETARAIILMSESYIMEKLCRKQGGHPEEVANVLLAILERVCFGELSHPLNSVVALMKLIVCGLANKFSSKNPKHSGCRHRPEFQNRRPVGGDGESRGPQHRRRDRRQ